MVWEPSRMISAERLKGIEALGKQGTARAVQGNQSIHRIVGVPVDSSVGIGLTNEIAVGVEAVGGDAPEFVGDGGPAIRRVVGVRSLGALGIRLLDQAAKGIVGEPMDDRSVDCDGS